MADFSWATLTASVSNVPAATPVIWRVTVAASLSFADAPTAIALWVATQAFPVTVLPLGLKPATPAARFATE